MFADIGSEFRGALLGDERRSARLERIGVRLALDPSKGFPEAMASEGQLEAFYRFVNNDEVSFPRILGPHSKMTARRCGGRTSRAASPRERRLTCGAGASWLRLVSVDTRKPGRPLRRRDDLHPRDLAVGASVWTEESERDSSSMCSKAWRFCGRAAP
jgi:hypothetical protein